MIFVFSNFVFPLLFCIFASIGQGVRHVLGETQILSSDFEFLLGKKDWGLRLVFG